MSGSGGGGGYEYQAKATAYVAAHILSGQRLNWIEHGKADIPVAVAEETGGAGDDLNITLEDSTVIELQAKHGLKKDDKFWKAILKLGQGLKENENLYGVLLTDSTASKVLREDLRQDLKRLGQGRFDGLKAITKEVQNKFESAGLPTEETEFFRRLRIVVLDIDDDLQDGKQGYLLLTQVLQTSAQASFGWSVLCQEGQSLLSNCGRRDAAAWARLLTNKGILIKSTYAQMHGTRTPEELQYLMRLLDRHKSWWKRSFQFLCEIQGIELSAWHPFTLSVESRKPQIQQEPSGVESEGEKSKPILELLQSSIKEPVLIFGKPGAGKSTFLEQALFELAQKACQGDQDSQTPVLIQVKPNSTQSNFLYLIKESLENQNFLLGQKEEEKIIYIENLIQKNRLFLLIDIVNELPREIQDSLRAFCDRGIPMIVAMRDIGAGGLGIREKFEIQSLKPQYVRDLFQTRLPSSSQQDIQTLCERVRDFGQTPLMVWMLYSIFIQRGETPKTRGEAYRVFTTVYEEEAKGGITLDASRAVLTEVGFMMTGSNEPLYESRIQAKFGDQVLKTLLANHLLYWTGEPGIREVSFCHPSLQEYYVAQYFFRDPERLELWLVVDTNQQHSRFQQDYLNYTKWTEPIALLLGLCEEDIAISIVEQALTVDLMLGARLAGEVRSEFQEKTVDLLNHFIDKNRLPEWLKIEFLGQTRSKSTLHILQETARSQDYALRESTAEALGYLAIKESIPILISLLKDKEYSVRITTVKSLGLIGDADSLPYLIEVLEDENPSVCLEATESIVKLGCSNRAISQLLEIIKDKDKKYELRRMASFALEKFKNLDIVPEILDLLRCQNSPTRELAIEIAGSLNDESILKELSSFLSNIRFYKVTVKALEKIHSYEAVMVLKICLENDNNEIRRIAACALGRLGQKDAIPELLKILQEKDYRFLGDAVYGLGVCGSEEATPLLKEMLLTVQNREFAIAQNGYVSKSAIANSLSKIKHSVSKEDLKNTKDPDDFHAFARILAIQNDIEVLPILREFLKNTDSKFQESAAYCLALMGCKDGISILMNVLENEKISARWWISEALVKTNTPEILKQLWEFHKSGKVYVMETIQGIQYNCKFYNYEIHQKTIDRKLTAAARGNPQDRLTNIEQGVNQLNQRTKQMAEQPNTVSISGGTFNGPVNLASNQGTQPTTIIDTQNNNYFGTDETFQQKIVDLQQLITELENQHPNLNTETQATEIVQQKLNQIQTQNPDRWQKLRDQMAILKQQFFNRERHAQALKATLVEVTKAKWEESLIVKAIVTYLDKFSETPEKGA